MCGKACRYQTKERTYDDTLWDANLMTTKLQTKKLVSYVLLNEKDVVKFRTLLVIPKYSVLLS